MSLSVSTISTDITAHIESQGPLMNDQENLITLSNGKTYSVVLNDKGKVKSASRVEANSGLVEAIKTFFATVFGTRTTDRIASAYEDAKKNTLEKSGDDLDDFEVIDVEFANTEEVNKYNKAKEERRMGLKEIASVINELAPKGCVQILDGIESTPDNIGKKLNLIKLNKDNKPILVPIGLSERGFMKEPHAVLGVITEKGIYIVDSKNNKYPSPIISLTTKFQDYTDRTNCGRYTAYTAIEIAKAFENKKPQSVSEAVSHIPKPFLNKIQQSYTKHMY